MLLIRAGRAGIEPAKPCTPTRQSIVVRKNDRRSYVSEDLRRSIQAELRRDDLHQSRAGGIRTRKHLFLRQAAQPMAYHTVFEKATHTGFEPVFSAVTGQRPLLAGPMGQR